MFASLMAQIGLFLIQPYMDTQNPATHHVGIHYFLSLPPYAQEEVKPFGPSWIQTHITC